MLSFAHTQRMAIPDVRYARSGEVAIAYQSIGAGDLDIVWVRSIAGDLLSTWEEPRLVRHIEGLARLGRVLLIDRRGTGLSDRMRDVQSLETVMDDVRAVMDDAGSERAVLFTGSSSTGIGALFAATYPDRCAGLILVDPRARGIKADDYPWAPSEREWQVLLASVRKSWGDRNYLEQLAGEWAPDLADDVDFREWFVWHARRSLSPGAAATAYRAERELDIRDLLPAVRVPVLLLARSDQPGPARYMARHLPNATITDVPEFRGAYTWANDESHEVTMQACEAFCSSLRLSSAPQKVLVTVLFTDIVGSTELMSEIGDAAWRDLIVKHHAIVRTTLAANSGRELDTAGDGFFAVFDGPARAVRAAEAIVKAVRPLGIEVRAGLHTGECEVSEGKVAGIAVSIGARICSLAGPGCVLVSSTVKDLVSGSELRFDDDGEHLLKGVAEPRRLYQLVSVH
jgi:class 3 adenylate cyclase